MELPTAPTAGTVALRGDYEHAAADYTVTQDWSRYSDDEHDIWRTLWSRQLRLAATHAAPEFLRGVELLGCRPDRIPRFDETSEVLERCTGWRIVAVPGLIPEKEFFLHLSRRRFPVTVWIRRRDELDYLVEPDLFHDFFGHVPLLAEPAFAGFVEAYGRLGPLAERHAALHMLARLYWYMVEFGLIRTPSGLRAYGAGMLSSAGETRYCLESARPNRIAFDLERVLRTGYMIDEFQKTYFVVERFKDLYESVRQADFAAHFRRWAQQPALAAETILPGDRVLQAGELARHVDD